MAFNPQNVNGSATSANSSPVVIASDQAAVLISQTDTSISGTISATDVLAAAPAGNGVFIATAPTASSFVAAAVPGGSAQADIQITGTATGTYYFEASMDSTTGSDGNWIATNYRQTGIINTVLGYSATAVGLYRGAPSGFKYIRVRNVGGTTPSNPIIFRYSNGSGTTFLNASIPAGTNAIGSVTQATAANFNATVVGTGTFVTQSTLAAETTKVIGTVNVAAAQTIAVTQATGTNLHTVVDSGTLTAVTAITNALPTGANTIGAVTGPAAAALALDATLTGGTQKTKLVDAGGTNTGTIKAASTAAVATDTALVVALSPNNPLTTTPADITATASITTQNLVPAGVATAGSAAQTTNLAGMASASVQVTGTYTGALSAQATVDGTNWVTLGGAPFLGLATGAFSATIASAAVGIFQLDVAGFKQFRITGLAAMTGTAVVTIQCSNGAGMVALDAALPTGANTIGAVNIAAAQTLATVTTVATVTNITNQGNLVDNTAFTPATSRVMVAGFEVDEVSTVVGVEGSAGVARMTLDRKQIISAYAHTSGGATPFKLVSAATTNATSVKATAGQIYMITASNVNAAPRYLKIYNLAVAPTVGTSVPTYTFIIPGNTAGAGTNIPIPACGIAFGTGIALALTTEATDVGLTAVAVSEIVINLAYL